MLSVLCRAGLYLLLAVSSALACAAGLPPAVAKALKQARLPQDALVAVVAEAGRPERPRLSYQAELPVNPASLMKLFTTYAALDLLGPAYSWTTPVYLDGRVVNPGPVGVLEGSVYIQGRGDPTLVLERVWLLVQRLRQAGVREIRGDIVLDRSAFSVPDADPGDFDGEPYRPYNVRPDALLFNFKSLTLSFEPDVPAGVARISVEPSLAGLRIDESVALANGPCEDWRSALKADFNDPARIRFGGGFAATCGERQWPLAYADPRSYNARLLIALWQGAGGLLSGQVREGTVPPGLKPAFEFGSPPLADAVRGINKFSNNTMAQQLFLTLGLTQRGTGSFEAAREVVAAQAQERVGCSTDELMLDNGAGLSRDGRVSARCMARLLQAAWGSAVMPELLSSLPVAGVDGTTKQPDRAWGRAQGRAHLKTGSLRDVTGLAGVVLGASGRRYVLVAIVNHPNAAAARPALDALVQWTAADGSAPRRRP